MTNQNSLRPAHVCRAFFQVKPMRQFILLILLTFLAACGGSDSSSRGGGSAQSEAGIHVLSNRPDLISGGDALIEVITHPEPGATQSQPTQVTLNGVNIADQVQLRENGRVMGLVTGLQIGENSLSVKSDSGSYTTTITNHPNFGPVFSAGQHRLSDWDTCAAGQPSEHNDCNQAVQYRYFYKPSDPTQLGLVEFNIEDGIPADAATTTTDNGETMPFVVRREDGYQDRDRYTIMVLFNPDKPWTALAPQAQWNHKLLIPHGGGCNISFEPGSPRLDDSTGSAVPLGPEHSYITALGRGFAVLSTALNNNGHNCGLVLQAESMIMAKERLVEQYGELRYTIGTGCSGGAITQQTVANAYPGVYQGLLTTCSYPDSMSPAVQAVDYHLLRQYFEDPSRWDPTAAWSPHQFGLVEGHVSHVNAVLMDELLFKPSVTVDDGCAGPDTYHAENNPDGYRCGAIEWNKHIWGTRTVRAKTDDRDIEVTNMPAGNVGIQYGLENLMSGTITPAQFVDLNVKIGGLDYDMIWQPERTVGEEAVLASAYRSGATTVGNNLDTVAIINFVGPDPGAAHDSIHAWWTRWRLDREFGHHDNHVMWGGPAILIGDPYFFEMSLLAMDRWLTAVEADTSDTPLPAKIINNKPEDIHDQCSNGMGTMIADEMCNDLIRTAYAYGTPRTVAGADEYATNYECQLKPFNRDDYAPIPFTEDQFAKLETVFANGVCDYSVPGLAETTKTVPWLTYQDGEGGVVIGGKPLPPAALPAGLASKSFILPAE